MTNTIQWNGATSPPAYQNKRLKKTLQVIIDHAERVEPQTLEQAKAEIRIMGVMAEAALERFPPGG